MADYDTTVGVQLKDNFEVATDKLKKFVSAMDILESITKKNINTLNMLNRVICSMSKLNGMDFPKMDSQINNMVKTISLLESKLQKLNISGLTGVANALRSIMNNNQTFNLSGIEKMMEIPTIMKSIETMDSKNMGKVFSTLATQIQPFIAKLKEASNEINNLGTVIKAIDKFNSKFDSVKKSVDKFNNAVDSSKNKVSSLGNEGTKTSGKLNKMFSVGNMIYYFNMSKRIFSGVGNVIKKSIDFAETENLFSVAMRNMRGEAMKFQNQLAETFGMALPEMMKYQGLFKNMLSAIQGLNQETATGLSEVMTKMSIDFASLYNTSIESAMTKMQSALSRQVRPIRSVSGYDITQNVLGDSLLQMGIYDRTVKQLSEMEKRLVIIYTLQQQMSRSGAMGDLARTIEQPAQQLKILQQQLSETARWIGAVFMGTIGKVLPYINAFVMVIKELVRAFAMFTGYKVPDSSGVGNILDQMDQGAGDFGESLGGAIDNANEGLDKAKKTVDSLLAPFDKLNIIQKPQEDTSSSSGGSGSSSGIGAIDDRILASLGKYDNMMDNVKMKATAIRDRIMEWLGFTKTIDGLTGETVWKLKEGYTNIKKLKDMAVLVGTAFASWKIAKTLTKFLLMGAEGIPLFSGIKKLYDIMVSSGFVGSFATVLATVAKIAGVISYMVLRFVDLVTNSEEFRRGIGFIWDIITSLVGSVADVFSVMYNGVINFGKALGLSEESTRSVILLFGSLALAFTIGGPFFIAIAIFETLSVAIKALGYAVSPCIEQFDNLAGASEQTKTNLEPMLETMDDMETNLKQMDWSNIAPDADAVAQANESVNKFSNDLITHLENSKKKAIDTMSDLFKNASFSQKEQNEMINGVNSTYDNISTKVKEAQETITSIYNTANSENRALSDEEVQTIASNQDWLKTQSVQILSASAEEQNTILNNINANAKALDAEQASVIIKNSIETRNKTKTEAESRYQEQLAIAKKLKQDGGAENEALATKIIKEAERQKTEATNKANEMHANIIQGFKDQNPEVAKYLDEGTGNIKTNLDVWIESFKTWCAETGTAIANWWNNSIAPWFTFDKWAGIAENIKTSIITKWNEMVESWKIGITSWWDNDIAPWFTLEKWVGILQNMVNAFAQKWNETVNFFTIAMPNWWNSNIAPWFTLAKWAGLVDSIRVAIINKWNEMVTSWRNSISNWWSNDIAPWFTIEKWKNLISGAISGVVNKFYEWKSNFNPIRDWWNNSIAPWFTWDKWYNLGMGAIRSVTSAFSNFRFPSFKLPHISWVANGISTSGWIREVLSALSLPTSLPGLNVSWYRKGGFVGESAGQLFAANEPGNPELIGNIGGQTAVVNNNMIIEAIEGAMTRAVVKGMQSIRTEKSDGTIIIENYYDGELIERKIVEANDKHERKTGKPVFSR